MADSAGGNGLPIWQARAIAAEARNVELFDRVSFLEAELLSMQQLLESRACHLSAVLRSRVEPSDLERETRNQRPTLREPAIRAGVSAGRVAAVAARSTAVPAHGSQVALASRTAKVFSDQILSEISEFTSVRDFSHLRGSSQTVCALAKQITLKSWGAIAIDSFKMADDFCLRCLVGAVKQTRHGLVKLLVGPDIHIPGYPLSVSSQYKARRQEEVPLHILNFVDGVAIENVGPKYLLQSSFPMHFKVELLEHFTNIRTLHLTFLQLAYTFFDLIAERCVRLETLVMHRCKGNRDRPLYLDGSFACGFASLKRLEMDFYHYGGYFGAIHNDTHVNDSDQGVSVLFGKLLDRLEHLSMQGNCAKKVTCRHFRTMLPLAINLRTLKLSRDSAQLAADEHALIHEAQLRGIHVSLDQ